MKRWLARIGITFGVLLVLLAVGGYVVYSGGVLEGPGKIEGKALPPEAVAARAKRQVDAAPEKAKQILFGDLHVHTTYSMDAFFRSLPMVNGEGAHPPADACDFARYCSQLDFFSFNDHAEALTPEHWQETKETVRQCNALAGDAENPDLVVFAGWEWTQVGLTAEEHYGHKNVIFRDEADDKLPRRAIAAPGQSRQALRGGGQGAPRNVRALWVPLLEFSERQRYLDLAKLQRTAMAVPDCPTGVDSTKITERCHEEAATPKELFEKLEQWGLPTLVIPHGTTWGLYTPPGYSYDKQIAPEQNHAMQSLIEIYSGHGNSEEHRAWRAALEENGKLTCPEPTDDYEPCCWRAGEIIRSRCGDAPAEECEKRVVDARAKHLAAGMAGHLSVPGHDIEQWGNCGQCEDCFLPTFDHKPGGSVQYIMAKGSFAEGRPPAYAPMGFIGSSDVHTARPGTGYKEFARRRMADASGPKSAEWRERLAGRELPGPKLPESYDVDPVKLAAQGVPPFAIPNFERAASFFTTGGLVAAHSAGRSRGDVWDALERREVYATSGERILLWFDLVADDATRPMGSSASLGVAPKFKVRAVGAFEQKAGCPEWSAGGLSKERTAHLCADECYNPGDERRPIAKVEVVRIRPQIRADEPVTELIEDVWKTLECQGGPVCEVEFDDPSFVEGGRDVYYYVRALQNPTPAVNAGNLRCDRDASGKCIKVNPCYGDYRTSYDDDCLAPVAERAWSSPIFVQFDAEAAKKARAEAEADDESKP